MPATSLVKFMNQKEAGGKPLYWGRADEDGAPYRGTPPTLPREEFENRLARVCDPHNGVFDLGDPEQNKQYLEVLDKITNGWAQAIFVDRKYDEKKNTWLAYVEWVEVYMEDGSPMHSQHPYLGRLNDG